MRSGGLGRTTTSRGEFANVVQEDGALQSVELRGVDGDLGEEGVGHENGRLVAMAGVGVAQQVQRCRPEALWRDGRARTGSAWPCRSRSWRCRCGGRPCGRRAAAATDCGRGADRERLWLPADRLPICLVRGREPRELEPVPAPRPRGICGSDGTARWLCGIAPNYSGHNAEPHVVRQMPSWLP